MPNWSDVLDEINKFRQRRLQSAALSVDITRKKYLRKYARLVGRNVIAYYSGWLSKPQIAGLEIRDEDKNAFMMAVHGLDRSRGLDLILHTPGGEIAAAESIVNYLHAMFGNDIRAVVPQIAMSAGTMIACACKEILLGKQSNLGPVDPQLNGIPAHGVLAEFDKAHKEILADSSKISVWQFVLSKYPPTFLNQCQQAIQLSEDFVRRELVNNMFHGDPEASAKADYVVKELTDYSTNLVHSRHFHIDDCKKMGLKIKDIEHDQNYQDIILTVHHCYMHTLMNTPAFKIIENQNGVAFIKNSLEKSQNSP